MKRATVLVLLFALAACGGGDDAPKPLSEPGERLYTMRGVILSRDTGGNSVRVDHEPIAGFMEAMVMDYNVRGADVATLPPDKTRVEAKLHVTDRSYWLTDVRPIQ